MMRKQLGSPEDLDKLPSYLGHIFRLSYYGYDSFNYEQHINAVSGSTEVEKDLERDRVWKKCRDEMGMYGIPDRNYELQHRQQYSRHHLPT
jgi:hypothetical protein